MVPDPEAFSLTWSKNSPDAEQRLAAALEAARDQKGCHLAWARLCEEAGFDAPALREYQLCLRDNPDETAALERLSVLYCERGETERALECAERHVHAAPGDVAALRGLIDLYLENDMKEQAEAALARARDAGVPKDSLAPIAALIRSAVKADESEQEEQVASSLGIPSDADVARFAHLYAGRENVYARQWWDESGQGGYTPVRQPLVFQVVRNHLLGSITIGVYPIRLDNTVTFMAIDIDINKRAIARARGSVQEARAIKDKVSSEARRLQGALRDLEMPALLEDSGYKGRHLWVFLQEPIEAGIVRQFGSLFIAAFPLESMDLHAEFFPKQSTAGAGIGNLIKLPLGIHRRTGRRARLLLADGSPDPDPFGTLREIRRLPRETLFRVIVSLKSRPTMPVPAPFAPEEPETQPPMPLPLPPAPAPAWTVADFEINPEISQLLRNCAVIAALKEKVLKHRRLAHDEQVVLTHSLGHSSAGVLAVNYLFDSCVDVPATARLQTPLSGNPISCPRIRKRIPHVTGQVDCNCSFESAADQYPTPRLHLATLPRDLPAQSKPEPAWDPAERTRALGVLRRRRQEIEREIVDLEKSLQAHMERLGKDCIELEEGALVLKQEAGALPALEWEPKADPPAPAAPKDG